MKGKKAVENLKAQGNKAGFHQLDVTSTMSINALQKSLTEKYAGLDLLVNNAGVYSAPLPSSKQVSCHFMHWPVIKINIHYLLLVHR